MYEPVNRISNFVLVKHKAKRKRMQGQYHIWYIFVKFHNQRFKRNFCIDFLADVDYTSARLPIQRFLPLFGAGVLPAVRRESGLASSKGPKARTFYCCAESGRTVAGCELSGGSRFALGA